VCLPGPELLLENEQSDEIYNCKVSAKVVFNNVFIFQGIFSETEFKSADRAQLILGKNSHFCEVGFG